MASDAEQAAREFLMGRSEKMIGPCDQDMYVSWGTDIQALSKFLRSREEVAREEGKHLSVIFIEKLREAAFREGQERMRERAALLIETSMWADHATIRALPIEERKG